MKIIKNLSEYSAKTPLALSIGMFDGVHLGHQSIINKLNAVAARKNLQSGILTFWPHPRKFFNPDDDLKLLNTIDEKIDLLTKHGVQNLFLKQFDEDFRNLCGEDFIREILVKKLNIKHLIIGYDHTFGKNKSGDFSLLKKMAPEFGFEVEQVEPVDFAGKNISSTQVRKALCAAKIEEANQMLGYNYALSGKIVHGKKLGKSIGYPTANIGTDPIKLLPKNGAYIVEVFVKNRHCKGMLSIGTNPTVSGDKLSVEVHILEFDGDIYGEQISVHFRAFLHDEIKFDNLQQLVLQLDQDKIRTAEFRF